MISPREPIAVIGATGAVGREVLSILAQRCPQLTNLDLYASARSVGQMIVFNGQSLKVQLLSEQIPFSKYKVVFLTAGGAISEVYAPLAAKAGCLVIDNSSFFRMHKDVPLVVPEVNAHDLSLAQTSRIVANPNCTTAQLVMALKPIDTKYKLKRVVVASYQAVSGRGQQGIDEFAEQRKAYQAGQPVKAKVFSAPIAFNCIPQIDRFLPSGFTGEEEKVMNETRKILSRPDLSVVATCVRVPVVNSHSEAVFIETHTKLDSDAQIRKVIAEMPGVKIVDDPENMVFPVATMAHGQDDVLVGRIRKDPSVENGLAFWIVADNLRKGAALNAVQIMEAAMRCGLVALLIFLSTIVQAEEGHDGKPPKRPTQGQPYIDSLKQQKDWGKLVPEESRSGQTYLDYLKQSDEKKRARTKASENAAGAEDGVGDENDKTSYTEKLKIKYGTGSNSDNAPSANTDPNSAPYLDKLKSGDAKLEPKYKKTVKNAVYFHVTADGEYTIDARSHAANSFESIYRSKKKYNPGLDITLEHQFFRDRYWGAFGPHLRLGFNYFSGYGRFLRDGSEAEVNFKLFALPVGLGLGYRANQLRFIVPFVHLGYLAIPFRESRDDDKPAKKGFSSSYVIDYGLDLSLDWIARSDAWERYDEYGILHTYLSLKRMHVKGVQGAIRMNYALWMAGLTFEI